MKDPAHQHLIAADVSGDLSEDERSFVDRIYAGDPGLARLRDQLRADARLLRSLPMAELGVDLSPAVAAAVQAQPIIRLHSMPARPAGHRWVGWSILGIGAVAAGLLLVVRPDSDVPVRRPNPEVARQANRITRPAEMPPAPPEPVPAETTSNVTPPAEAIRPEPPREPPPPGQVFTSRPVPVPQPVEVVKPRTSLPLTSRDLVSDGGARLVSELKSAQDHRIDLFADQPAVASDLLVRVLRDRGVKVNSDFATGELLRKKIPTSYAIYTESLTAAETSQALKRLTGSESGLNHVVVAPIADTDRRELRIWLSADPFAPRPSNSSQSSPPSPTIGSKPGTTAEMPSFIGLHPLPKPAPRDLPVFLPGQVSPRGEKIRLYIIVRGIGN
jgi:hypothetical protein